MAKYGDKASAKVHEALHEEKEGKLKSGRSGRKVTSRKQAIAIGLSEARKEGDKVPPRKSAAKKSGAKTASKKTASKETAPRKAPSKKSASKKTGTKTTTARKSGARKTAAKKSASRKT
jgi:hypothetical protein